MLKPCVIDLYHGNVVYESLKEAAASGILGLIHKASEGATVIDRDLEARAWLAKDAGLRFGCYHFIRPSDRQAQMNNFLAQARKVDTSDMLIALDYEDPKVELDTVEWFLRQLEQISQRSPVLYSGHVLKEKLAGVPNPALAKYRLWLAQYGPQPKLPPGWDTYWLWQYSETGEVPGIKPPTDLNAYLGDAESLKREWSGRRSPVPPPVPPPEPQPEPESEPGPAAARITITIESPFPLEVEVEQVLVPLEV